VKLTEAKQVELPWGSSTCMFMPVSHMPLPPHAITIKVITLKPPPNWKKANLIEPGRNWATQDFRHMMNRLHFVGE
jgi:hypothetical protein